MKIHDKIRHRINRLKHKGYKPFDGCLRIYLTLECNLFCSYCVNQCHSKEKLTDKVRVPGEKWVAAINKIGKNVIFTGGEPTLHPDFLSIMKAINPTLSIKLYTNLVWDEKFLARFIDQAPKQLELCTSYHPSGGRPEPFIDRIILLKNKGYLIKVHSIDHEQQKKFIAKSRSKFETAGIELTIDEDQSILFADSCSQEQKQRVICRKKIILISPEGDRYPCVSKMVRRKEPLENIFKTDLKKDLVVTDCKEYGFCAPCDMLGEVVVKKKV